MPTTLNSGLQLPDKGSVDWYSSMQTNYNLLDNHLENTDIHVTAEDKANWDSKQGSLSQTQLDAIAQVATNTSDIATLQSGKANASHTHSSSDITDIGDYATKQYVDNSISGLVDSAPNALDTFNELAAALNDDANFATTVINALSNKANSADLATVATSGSYTDLSNKPSIPANTSDLTNDSNFVDTSNSAVSSGITSAKVTDYDAHIADTDIHVTTADKSSWDGKADDSSVVHKSGDETIAGGKTFLNSPIIYNPDTSVNDYLVLKNSKVAIGSTTDTGSQRVVFQDKNGTPIGSLISSVDSNGWTYTVLEGSSLDSQSNIITRSIRLRVTNTGAALLPSNDNNLLLGSASARWSNVYSVNYYYGSNNIEFSTKFVTSDTNQNITGTKTFNSDLTVANTDTTANTPNLTLRNYKADRGTTDTAVQAITFLDKNSKALTMLESRKISNGNTATNILCYNTDDSNNTVSGGVAIIKSKTDTNFAPNADNAVTCGRSLARWSDVQTYEVNALEPSSLSLPSGRSARIDISSYITNLGNGDNNSYIVPANGYIWLHFTSINSALCYSQTSGGLTNYAQTFVRYQGDGQLYAFFPVRKGDNFVVQIYTSSTAVVQNAYFIPCQGNV